jgi:hypothetical protein
LGEIITEVLEKIPARLKVICKREPISMLDVCGGRL